MWASAFIAFLDRSDSFHALYRRMFPNPHRSSRHRWLSPCVPRVS
jgi:hypothetical protein